MQYAALFITAVLVILKLAGWVAIGWWVVFAPVLIVTAIGIILVALFFLPYLLGDGR